MSKRASLWVLLLILSGMAGVMFLFPLAATLAPTAAAINSLPHIRIADLGPGRYRYVESESGYYPQSKFLVLRERGGEIHVYAVPMSQGKYRLPDAHWFRWGALCDDFGPESSEGLLKEGGLIKCHDSWTAQFGGKEWEWTYAGKNRGNYTDDMHAPPFVVEGDYVVLGKRT